jgi:hypothetical protein
MREVGKYFWGLLIMVLLVVNTVTGLGGQRGERRQPRLGGGDTVDTIFLPSKGGGVHLPAPPREIPLPQNGKFSALAPEPSEHL